MSARILMSKDFRIFIPKWKTGRQQIMTVVKMLIIIFMQDSSVILSDDAVPMRVYFRTEALNSHKNTLIIILLQ